MKTPAVVSAAFLVFVLAACSDAPAPENPGESEPVPTAPKTTGATGNGDAAQPAPSAYRAFLIDTHTKGWVLSIHTSGSSSCPFEMDSVTVVGSVIEVVDEIEPDAEVDCTADDAPMTAEYPVEPMDVGPFLSAESVVITTMSGDRLSMDLTIGVE